MSGCSAPETSTEPDTTTSSTTPSDTDTVTEEEEETTDGLDTPDDVLPDQPDGPTPIPSKIRYVVVLVKENHTFDNLFTDFPGAESSKTAKKSTGEVITRPKAPNGELPVEAVCHSNNCGKKAYRDGTMSGFDLTGAGDVPFIRYTKAQIPNYWRYAEQFVLADHLFQTTLGPSSTGHTVFWTGKSLSIRNAECTDDCDGYGCTQAGATITTFDPETCETEIVKPCFDVPSLPDHLPEGFTWRNYGRPIGNMVKTLAETPKPGLHFRGQSRLLEDLAAGKLANLTILHATGDISEHPPKPLCPGENFTVRVVNALMAMPQWSEMAIVVTWDDWGGFYDHVAPLIKHCDNGEMFQQGFRLPLLLLSPYAKEGFVLETPAEQASVPRMIEDLWGMTYMTERDPNARDGIAYNLMDAFDFNQEPRAPLLLEERECP